MAKAKNKLFIALALCLLLATSVFAEDQIWIKDYDVALEQASKEKKPIFVFVTAKWCSFCTMMHNSTLTNKSVITTLKDYILVEIDYDNNPELCAKWGAEKLPTLIIFNQFGEKVVAESGYKEPNDFRIWLRKYEAGATSNVSIKEEAKVKIQLLFDGFKKANATDQTTMFASILDQYYLEKEQDMKSFTLDKMVELLQANPNYFIILLNHSRLEARMLAALIIEKLKLNFVYDPWESNANRQEQIKAILPNIASLQPAKIQK
jgi:thioredoxin-related protein